MRVIHISVSEKKTAKGCHCVQQIARRSMINSDY